MTSALGKAETGIRNILVALFSLPLPPPRLLLSFLSCQVQMYQEKILKQTVQELCEQSSKTWRSHV